MVFDMVAFFVYNAAFYAAFFYHGVVFFNYFADLFTRDTTYTPYFSLPYRIDIM